MWFLGIGLVLLFMKYMDMSPVAAWDWWLVLAPFGLAAAWWAWADLTGYTKAKAMKKEAARVKARREKQKEALGLGVGKNKR